MISMKKTCALLCITAILICCFTGCAGNTKTATTAPTASVTSAQPAEAADSDSEQTAAVAVAGTSASVSYPLEGQETFSIFYPEDTMAFSVIDSWSSVPTLQYVYEKAGFKFDFMSPGETQGTEQFNLMIASGDWTDFFSSSWYNGGSAQAYADGVIYDLSDLIQKDMPDYWTQFKQQSVNDQANLYNDDGNILFVSSIKVNKEVDGGLLVRQDMLDAAGVGVPTTTDELEKALAAVYAKYGCKQPFYVDTDGIMSNVVGAFGTTGYDVSGKASDKLSLYQQNGTVKSSLQSEGFYNYLQYFNKLYNEHLINNDFYSQVRSADLMNNITLGGESCIWSGQGGLIDTLTANGRKDNKDYKVSGVGYITLNKDDTYQLAPIVNMVATSGTCISTSCEDADKALQALNWFFTEDGRHYCTWGAEGITYEKDANGQEQFTTNITDGKLSANLMYGVYLFSPCAMYSDKTYINKLFSDNVLNAYDLWANDGNSDCVLPALSLTTEETEACTTVQTDIGTYAGEIVLQFMIGELPLNEANWKDFQNKLTGMGIDKCIATYQTAYERFLNRSKS